MSNLRLFRVYLAVTAVVLFTVVSGCRARKEKEMGPTPGRPLVDRSVQELMDKLDTNSFKTDWVSARASVTTIADGNETSFTINMRARRDSVIWISITPLLGIEVARVIVTPDSVKMMDRIHSKYTVSSFETINKLLQLRVNFEIVQSMLWGNFFAYKKNENRFNSVYTEDKEYILSSLNKNKLRRSLEENDPNKPVIQDVYVMEGRFRPTRVSIIDQKIKKTLLTDYSDFRETDAGYFPFKSTTLITAEKKFEIKIEYVKLVVGEPQEFPFNIPASYERSR
jgi:hypothetical protein